MSGQAAPLSYNAAMVLQAIVDGRRHGFEIMKVSGLPSGTVYPLLGRLETSGLVRSTWEDEKTAKGEGRPSRRYYEPTPEGQARLAEARARIAAQQAAVFGTLGPREAGRD